MTYAPAASARIVSPRPQRSIAHGRSRHESDRVHGGARTEPLRNGRSPGGAGEFEPRKRADAEDQDQRFKAQVAAKDAGDDEAMFYDADYIRALEHGLPPTAGQGIGIDRLVMLFTNTHTIRDVILFPAMRPQAQG